MIDYDELINAAQVELDEELRHLSFIAEDATDFKLGRQIGKIIVYRQVIMHYEEIRHDRLENVNTENTCSTDHEHRDQTPFQCDCFTRGEDTQFKHQIRLITNILDGKDDGYGVAGEPWETIRRRILALLPVPYSLDPQLDPDPEPEYTPPKTTRYNPREAAREEFYKKLSAQRDKRLLVEEPSVQESCQHISDGNQYGRMEWGDCAEYRCVKCGEYYK